MSPLRKAASRSQTDLLGNVQQYGRSSTNLHAEMAAAALRDPGTTQSPPSTSTTNLLRKSSSHSTSSTASQTVPRGMPSLPLPMPPRQQSYAPAVPSPLNPASPAASVRSGGSDGRSNNISDDANQLSPQSTDPSSSGSASRGGPPALPPPRGSRGRKSRPAELQQQASSPSLRPQNMTLSDLGHDYSRYPYRHRNSYVESSPPPSYRNASLVDAAGTPLPLAASPVGNPFNDSARPSTDADGEKAFSPFIDDRLSAPISHTDGFPMFVDEKEWDDDMHMPYPDDDQKLRPKLKDYFSRGAIVSTIGFLVLLLGLLCIFVVMPIATFMGLWSTPSTNTTAPHPTERPWTWINDDKHPLLTNIRTSLIDPATPSSAMTRPGVNGDTLKLVFSDEFTKPNRSFYPGDDPYWTAPNIWYGATQDLEWYDPDAVTTYDGTLQLRLDKTLNHDVQFRSGMLNSWNQICFKGGALEVGLSLPGPAGVPGLWPGVWTMGNLGRPGYKASTEGVWPYTYDSCDAGITPNQSSPDGISHLPGQRLPSCTCNGEDHPSPGTGRGAPEIDVIEASVDPNNLIGVVTQSYQVAPYDIWYHPNYDFMAIPNVNTTMMNSWCGGPFQQGISGTTLLNNHWYDGKQYQKYAFEYTPGTDDGEIAWFVGENMSYMMSGSAVGPNGNIDSRLVSEEPMSIILNLGISNSWTWIDWARLTFPTVMYIDYVRWYQKDGEEIVTCDPPGYETTEYISNHPLAYNNPNLTQWNQTGYSWPQNKLMHDC